MSTPISDGGPAFPCMVFSGDANNDPEYANGMALRDWFAGMAMAGLQGFVTGGTFDPQKSSARFAETAYVLADALIAERSKGATK